MRRAQVSALIILMGSLVGVAQKKHSVHDLGPASLGTYTHDHPVALRPFLAQFGVKSSGRDIYCLADKEHGLYLYAKIDDEHDRGEVDWVFLSSFPNCRHIPIIPATIDLDIWKTPEGIGIGSSKEDVRRAYHNPEVIKTSDIIPWWFIPGLKESEKKRTRFGDVSYAYGCGAKSDTDCNDLRFAEFGFASGKVIWIAISDSE